MEIKTKTSYSASFSQDEAKLIVRLIREQVGHRTMNEILDDGSYVRGYYRAIFSMISKICGIGSYVTFDSEEINVLVNTISTAYNDGKHDDCKEMLDTISDAVKFLRGW